MTFPSFLKKKEKGKKGKSFDPEAIKDKCLNILAKIKEINEEKHNTLYRSFMQQFDKAANIQKKKINGFYAQLVDEFKSLQGSAQERLRAMSQSIIKKAETTAKKKPAAKKVVKKASKPVDKVAKKTAKKKVAKKATKETSEKVTKKTAKKKVVKKAAKKTTKKKTK